jgi:DNA-binding NarL/FixJ family response regulator
MSCWYLTADLMFASRVEGAAQRLEKPLVILPSPEALEQRLAAASAARPRLVVLDLALWSPQVLELISQLKALAAPPQIVAYGPHVQTAVLEAAENAGCDQVLTRGQFDQQMAAVLALA